MRIYDLLVPATWGLAVLAVALLFWPRVGPEPRPAGDGWLSWLVGLAMLGAGTWILATVGDVRHGADLGETPEAAVVALGACTVLGALRPARAGALLLPVAALLVLLLGMFSVLTWLFQPDEWQTTGPGPFLGGSVLVAAPMALAGALLRWSVVGLPRRGGASTGESDAGPAAEPLDVDPVGR